MTNTDGPPASRRIVFVVNNPDFFLSHRLPLAIGAIRAGYDVHVAAPDKPSADRIRAIGAQFHPLPLHCTGTRVREELGCFLALWRLYRAIRPTLVHHVTIKPVLYGTLAARLAGVPAVVNAISGLGYVFIASGRVAAIRRAVVRGLYQLGSRHARVRTIFQNPDDLGELVRAECIAREHAVLIPGGSGVDLDAFAPRPAVDPDPEPLVVLPSRLLWDKGVGEFVNAATQLRARGYRVRFALVGDVDGNPTAVPRERLQSWIDAGTVEWWGHRTDMPAVLARASIVCLPSYREGVPKALLEAAAAGCAIVTTDAPGCREVVRDGVNGLLVPVRDSGRLATAIAHLLDHPAERQRMGAAGRARAEAEFGVQRVVEATLALYRDVIGHARGAAVLRLTPRAQRTITTPLGMPAVPSRAGT